MSSMMALSKHMPGRFPYWLKPEITTATSHYVHSVNHKCSERKAARLGSMRRI